MKVMRRLAVAIGLIAILTSLLVGCGPTALPVIVEFIAAPSEIYSGESVTLFWNVTEATSISIDQGIGNVSAIGMKTVSPMTTTAYTLSATNVAGTVTNSVLVTVVRVYQPSSPSPSFTTYRDEKWGYTIGYPDDWFVETVAPEMISLHPAFSHLSWGSIFVMVDESSGPASGMAQALVTELEQANPTTFTLIDNGEAQGMWDWYVCYEYMAEYEYVTIVRRGEAYVKNTEQYMYVVNLDFEKENYDSYPLSQIVDTFTLLP